MLSDSTDNRQVHALPPTAEGLHAGLDVFNEVPGWEVADVAERFAPPHDAGPAGKDGIRCVAGEHLAAIEDPFPVVEGISGAHLGFLDRLDERELVVRFELPDHLAEEPVRPQLVI